MAKFDILKYFPMKDTLSLSILWNNATQQICVCQISHANIDLFTVYLVWSRFHVTFGKGK